MSLTQRRSLAVEKFLVRKMFFLIILSVVLFFVIKAWYKNHYQYWIKRGFPSDTPNFPLDSLSGTGLTLHSAEKFDEYYQQFKGQPIVGLFFVFTPALAVYDPRLIQAILVKDFSYFHDHYLYYNEQDDPLSAHLLAIEGQKWKDRRIKLTPIFTSGKMKMMFNTINEIGEKFVKAIEKDLKLSEELEVSEWLARYTTDVIGNIAFGIDCNCLENPETDFRKHGRKIFKVDTPASALKMLFVNSFQKFSRKMGFMFNDKDVADFFMNVFTETVDYRQKNNTERNDLIQILIQLKNNGLLSHEEAAAEAFIVHVGGFHTSASLMNFILYELALNHDIQVKLHEEIVKKINENGGNLTYDLISQMKYLEMVVNEALRKYPPVNVITRKCTKEYKIPGSNLVVPEGTQITIPTYSMHRDPQFFPDPLKFDPERFNDENVSNIRPFTYLPFGEGPRICIGVRFALMVTKIALVKLMTEFEFDKSFRTPIPMKFSVKSLVLSPENEDLFLKKLSNFWNEKGFPSPKYSFPFGALKGVGTVTTNFEAIDSYYKKYKGKAPGVGLFFFLKPTYLVISPELVKNILVRDFGSFHDRAFYYNKEDDPTSANLLTLEGQEWRERRIKLSPIFTSGKMKMMFDTVDKLGDKLIDVLKNKTKESPSLETRNYAARFTSDVIGNVAFGLECNCLDNPDSEFLKHGRRLFDVTPYELLRFIFSSSFPNLARKLHLPANTEEPTNFFKNAFLQTIEYREKNNIKRNDFVSLLLGMKEHFTPLELAAESFLVYNGGFETSSTLITFALLELALNPDIQDKLRKEINLSLEENENKLTYDALFGMKYLEKVMNETLRKHPPIPNTVRRCVKDYPIPGTSLILPKDTNIEIPIYSLHQDPEHYPNPSKFDPERFSPEMVKARDSATFIPFGDGPRNYTTPTKNLIEEKSIQQQNDISDNTAFLFPALSPESITDLLKNTKEDTEIKEENQSLNISDSVVEITRDNETMDVGVKFDKLNSENYHAWISLIRAVLEIKKLWIDIDQEAELSPAQVETARKAYFDILLRVDTEHVLFLESVAQFDSVKALRALREKYEGKGAISAFETLWSALHTTYSSGPVDKYIDKIRCYYKRLNEKGLKFPEMQSVCNLMMGLPREYDHIFTIFLQMEDDKIKFEKVANAVIGEQRRNVLASSKSFNSQSDPRESVAATSSHENKPLNRFERKKMFKCDHCGKKGHTIERCLLKNNQNEKFQKKPLNNFRKSDKQSSNYSSINDCEVTDSTSMYASSFHSAFPCIGNNFRFPPNATQRKSALNRLAPRNVGLRIKDGRMNEKIAPPFKRETRANSTVLKNKIASVIIQPDRGHHIRKVIYKKAPPSKKMDDKNQSAIIQQEKKFSLPNIPEKQFIKSECKFNIPPTPASIDMRFDLMQSKIGVVKLIQHFQFSQCVKTSIPVRDFTSFHDRGFYSNKKTDPLSCNLLTLEGQEWKDHRTKLSPVFTTGKIKMMFDLVDSIGDKFVKAIDKELNKTSVFEIRELMAKFSTDVISNIAFGIDSNCLEDPNSEFLKMGKRLFNLSSYEMMRLLFTSSSPEGGRMLGMVANPKEPCDFLRRVFTETLKERELKGTQRNDFVQLLFKLRETVPLSLDEMAAEAFIFFAGGFETSSSTLTFLLFELAQSHEIQQRMRREIQDGIEANDGKLTYDLLFNFEYLDMVVKEALRKYPIIPAMSRKCTQEYKIPDTDLIIEKVALIYYWFKKKLSFWENHGFLSVPGKIPFGSIGEMGRKEHSCVVLKQFYDKFKDKTPAVGVYFLAQPVLIPTDLELLKDVFVRHFDTFHDRGFYVNERDDPLTGHLFFVSGQRWKDLRAKLSPTFTSGKIKMMFGTVSDICDRMIDFIKSTANPKGDVEMKEVLSSFTTEVISSVAFGLETKSLGNPNNEFRKMADEIFNPPWYETIKMIFMNNFPSVAKYLKLRISSKKTTDFFMGVIQNTMNYRKENNIQRNDFLQLMIEMKNNGNEISDNEIAANSFLFFLAGFETSSSVATFALYELALNQDIQERLRQEIEEILSKYDGKVTYDGIMEMKYLDMVFSETLRKYPVVDIQFRKSTKDYPIPNTHLTIPSETLIIISSQAIHHDERFWDNPNEFNPERFTEENIKKRPPFAYIPFSEGPRICIGLRFGMIQTKIALVKLLGSYKFSPCSKTTIPMKYVPSAAFQTPFISSLSTRQTVHKMFFYLLVIVALIYYWFKKKFSFWENHGFLSVPGKIPFGSIGEMGRKEHSCVVLKQFYDKFKDKTPAVGVYFLAQPVLIPTDLELLKDVFVRHFDTFHDRGFYVNERDDPLTGHLFFVSGQRWKDLRAKLSPTFTSGKIKMMFGTVSDICDRMIDFIKPTANPKGDVEMKEVLSSFTTEVISSVAFGLETKSLGNPNNEFRKMADEIFNPPWYETIKVLFMSQFPSVADFLKLRINSKETTDFFMGVIQNTMKYRKENNIQRNDFLQLMIEMKNNGNEISDNEIAANSFVFFLAGFETSSSVATFALYELALNQEIQERLRQEIEEVLSKYDGKVTYDGIMEMKYLDMVFSETLRKYPVVDIQFRKSTKDYPIPNTHLTIPSETTIIISSQAIHHDERFWDNPNEFNPERFTEENIKKRHPFAYIPFSEGPRILLVYLFFKQKFSFWEKHGFPFIPGKFPLGSANDLGRKFHSSVLFKRFYDEHKEDAPGGVGMYLMTDPVFLPTDPEVVKDIFVRHFESFHDRGFYFNERDDPLTGHLFTVSGQQWKDLRIKLSPTFTSGKMKMMFGNVSDICDRMIDFIKPTANPKGDVEMKEVLSSFTTEVISSVAFGLETKCLGNPKNEFRKMAAAVFDPPVWEVAKFLFMTAFQDLSKFLRLSLNSKETTNFFMGVIENSLKYRDTNNVQRNDFLQLLIHIRDSESGLSFNEIAANSFVFFVAGFETSSSVATFALYELALNQEIQERLRQEIEDTVAAHDNKVTYEGIMEMKYLDMVFNETLRKYPVVDSQFRKCNRDYKIPNTNLTIPSGTSVIISAQALHHDERFWENPSVFDPERFTDENVKKRHPYVYIPFSEGPRICIGMRFGVMQTKIALVKLLQNFRFSPCEKTTIPMKFVPKSVFLNPVGGIYKIILKLYWIIEVSLISNENVFESQYVRRIQVINMSLNLFLTLAALAIGLLVYYVKRKYEYWKDRGFVSTKVDFPYGSIKGAGSTIHFSQVMQKIYTEYGNNTKAVGLYFFISPIMLVTDLELVKHVLVKDFGSFHDRGVYY
ncbi:CLUMA_CG018250, isoform A [Clunio marinus]|uniref:CLUMA_CG018250, isoform A n=1 Tax=Clunio marinus TaxID=568069 RepID=A0A1J1IY62_9DIPT|nr:CLUMA_CG018250, isoform A [Clunio marinus]